MMPRHKIAPGRRARQRSLRRPAAPADRLPDLPPPAVWLRRQPGQWRLLGWLSVVCLLLLAFLACARPGGFAWPHAGDGAAVVAR